MLVFLTIRVLEFEVMSKGRFLVVHFTTEELVDVVPDTWIDGEKCFWPSKKSKSKIQKLVKKFSEPVPEWDKIEYKLVSSSSCYEKAARKANAYCMTSNISDSGGEEGRIFKNSRTKQTPPAAETSFIFRTSSPIHTTPLASISESRAPVDEDLLSPVVEGILRKIFKELETIKSEQLAIRHMVAGACAVKEVTIPATCPKLPADTPEQLAEMEQYLSKKVNFSHLCSYFGGRGGVSAKDAVRRILASLLSNELSLRYNWKGTNGVKLAFSKFPNICRLITASVRQHHSFERTTEQEIEAAIKKWLIYSKDRNGGRARRARGVRKDIESTEIEAVENESAN